MMRKSQSGFTLMEILIAVAVLAIGVVAVVNLFPVGLQAARRAADFSDVAAAAQFQMELYMSEYDYNEMVAMFGVPVPDDTDAYPEPQEPLPAPYGDYSWQMAVRNIGTAQLNLLEASLNIYWLDRGQEQFETFVTYIADYGN